jgi:hypothetical protein
LRQEDLKTSSQEDFRRQLALTRQMLFLPTTSRFYIGEMLVLWVEKQKRGE